MIPASRRRVGVLYIVVASLLLGLGARVWDVQVASAKTYASLANEDRTEQVVEPAVRGEILDDTGQPMVDNNESLAVSVNMSELQRQSDGGVAVLQRLAKLLGMSYTLLTEKVRLCTATVHPPCWQGSPYEPIPVAENVSDRVALQVLESPQEYPGVTAEEQPVANYVQPISTDTAQVLGYLQPVTAQEVKKEHLPETGFSGVDLAGQSGLEEQYDQELRGTPGLKTVSINAAGQVTGTVKQTPAKAGDDLVTSINAKVQEDTENALAAAVQKAQAEGNAKATSGAAVVLTTKGRVVAMASYPTYNPSIWNSGLSEREFRRIFDPGDGEPIMNRATQGEYAPGSTWKVTTLAAAVNDGMSLYGLYNCPASISVGGETYANDGNPNEGDMTLSEALIQSCDTVFYYLGQQMWLKDHPSEDDVISPEAPVQPEQRMEVAWGFGRDTGIDLPEGSPGSVPTREWLYYFWKDNAYTGDDWCKYGRANGSYLQQIEYQDCHYGNDWTEGQAIISSIGDGYVTVTPLQLADAYAALANGGTLYSPRIGEELISPDGKVVQKITPPVIRHLPVSGTVLAYMRTALQGVVTQGTAAATFAGFPLNQVCVAGKTGTAEAFGNQPTSVFASFAPCHDPKYVVVMMIPDAGYGADVSGPAVRQIWEGIYGLEGNKAALSGGQLPAPPTMNAQGQIVETAAPAKGKAKK
jgi:penicillin-binding protein 2